MLKNYLSLLLIGSVVLLSGCSQEPPKCSDEETISLVKNMVRKSIIFEDIPDSAVLSYLQIELPRASGFDEKIKKYTCDAKLLAAQSYQVPITYESQLDDQNQHIVSLGGMQNRDLYSVRSAIAKAYLEKKMLDEENKKISLNPKEFEGRFPDDVINHPLLKERFKQVLGNQYNDFIARMDRSFMLTIEGDFIVGTGGMEHQFTINESAFAVDAKTGKVFVVVLKDGKSIGWFGVEDVKHLPKPLQDWYKDHGGQ